MIFKLKSWKSSQPSNTNQCHASKYPSNSLEDNLLLPKGKTLESLISIIITIVTIIIIIIITNVFIIMTIIIIVFLGGMGWRSYVAFKMTRFKAD